MARVLACGDIHGAYRALKQVLDRCNFDKENDTLIQLGDVADGWSETYQCVEELLTIKNLIAIRGNHDFWTLQWMASGYADGTHRGQGGDATIASYKDYLVPESHFKFFRYQHDYYVDEENRLFVHGGIVPKFKLSEGKDVHNFNWNRSFWAQALKNPSKGIWYIEDFKEVFIGHTTTLNSGTDLPLKAANIWNLDTGAGFQGKLTIMDINTTEFWQSDLVQDLYPDETGRRKIKA